MNERVNKFLLAGYKFMPEMHLRQQQGILQKFKEIEDSQYIYQNQLDKACVQHDMAYGDFKGLTRRIAYDKILCDTGFNIAKNKKYDGFKRRLASMVYGFF